MPIVGFMINVGQFHANEISLIYKKSTNLYIVSVT